MGFFRNKSPETLPATPDIYDLKASDLIATVENPKSVRLLVGGDDSPEYGYDHEAAAVRAHEVLQHVISQQDSNQSS